MKLFYSPTSPYVRKVMIIAKECGLEDKIEKLSCAANPIDRDMSIVEENPLGKVPTLLTDDGMALFDSRVIAEYLDAQHSGAKMFPADGNARWKALQLQALGDGLLDAALLARYETFARPAEFLWADWRDGQMAKINSAIAMIEAEVDGFGDRLDVGTISVACALGYLDFRYGDLGWRDSNPKAAAWFAAFSERASMKDTVPPEA